MRSRTNWIIFNLLLRLSNILYQQRPIIIIVTHCRAETNQIQVQNVTLLKLALRRESRILFNPQPVACTILAKKHFGLIWLSVVLDRSCIQARPLPNDFALELWNAPGLAHERDSHSRRQIVTRDYESVLFVMKVFSSRFHPNDLCDCARLIILGSAGFLIAGLTR